jgi:hypothetical protein
MFEMKRKISKQNCSSLTRPKDRPYKYDTFSALKKHETSTKTNERS